jgi:hypothetical protein
MCKGLELCSRIPCSFHLTIATTSRKSLGYLRQPFYHIYYLNSYFKLHYEYGLQCKNMFYTAIYMLH